MLVCTRTQLFNIHKQGKVREGHLLQQNYATVLREVGDIPFFYLGWAWGVEGKTKILD